MCGTNYQAVCLADESESSHQLRLCQWRRRCWSESSPLNARGRVKWAVGNGERNPNRLPMDGQRRCLQMVCARAPEESRRNRSIDETSSIYSIGERRRCQRCKEDSQSNRQQLWRQKGEPSLRLQCDSASLTNCTLHSKQSLQPSDVTDRHRLEIRLANTSCPLRGVRGL